MYGIITIDPKLNSIIFNSQNSGTQSVVHEYFSHMESDKKQSYIFLDITLVFVMCSKLTAYLHL